MPDALPSLAPSQRFLEAALFQAELSALGAEAEGEALQKHLIQGSVQAFPVRPCDPGHAGRARSRLDDV